MTSAALKPSRRAVLQAGVLAGGAMTLGLRAAGAKASVPGALSAFVIVRADGSVEITAHQPEIGQGVKTSFPMMIAEERDVDWSQVKVVQAPGNRAVYGAQIAGGSSATPTQFERMRRLGASARAMLIDAAAKGAALGVRARFAADPVLEEAARDPVAHFNAGHIRAHRNHFACAVRQRNDAGAGRLAIAPGGDGEIPVIDGAGRDAHRHLAPRRLGFVDFDLAEGFDSGLAF
jgi:CO/xanthine dehydrogenase Mo-binding subunit